MVYNTNSKKNIKSSNRKTRKNFTKEACSRNSTLNYSCFSVDSILKLKQYWNIRHPDNKIKETDIKLIWKDLKDKLSHVCNKESCWLKRMFIKNNLDRDLLEFTFAPSAPRSWKSNPYEWLNSLDILRVMKQLEKKYKDFDFIGPSPINYNDHHVDGECVWKELCEFDIKKTLASNKDKIGIIFNLDPHYKSGSHWVSLFISIPKQIIIYFDSVGTKIPKRIKHFVDTVIKQAANINIQLQFIQNKMAHQRKNTECGIYSIYFIEQQLKSRSPALFNKRISDSDIHKCRNVYFNV